MPTEVQYGEDLPKELIAGKEPSFEDILDGVTGVTNAVAGFVGQFTQPKKKVTPKVVVVEDKPALNDKIIIGGAVLIALGAFLLFRR